MFWNSFSSYQPSHSRNGNRVSQNSCTHQLHFHQFPQRYTFGCETNGGNEWQRKAKHNTHTMFPIKIYWLTSLFTLFPFIKIINYAQNELLCFLHRRRRHFHYMMAVICNSCFFFFVLQNDCFAHVVSTWINTSSATQWIESEIQNM